MPAPAKNRSSGKTKTSAETPREDPQKRKAAAACDGVLDRTSTTFGKLVTLAGLQIQGAGDYSHPQLDASFPTAVVNSVLQKRHEEVFSEWLSLSLEEQHKQLTEFFCSMWTVGKPRLPAQVRQALAPPTAREAERTLFLSDLECTISVIQGEH